jgi:hypothetical protein
MTMLRLKPEPERQKNRQSEQFEPSRSELESAERASGQFVNAWRGMISSSQRGRQGFTGKVQIPEEKTAGVSFEDVRAKIVLVARQASYFLSRFGKLPCFSFGSGDMPLCSTRTFFESKELGEKATRHTDGLSSTELADAERRFLDGDNHPMMVDMEEGESYLRDGLTRFLAHRVGGYPRGLRLDDGTTTPRTLNRTQLHVSGANLATPGDIKHGLMMVRVTCKSSGLRVHSSPAFFVDWNYFGDPSNPDVDGWLLPGRYIFATDGPCPPDYLPDGGVFPIPSQYNPHVKKF